MSVNIFYNQVDFFAENNLATPQVSRSSSNIVFGEKVGVKESVILNGQIHLENSPEDCDYFTQLNLLRNQLLNFFSEDYKSLEIKQDSTSIFKRDFCKILNVSFDNSNYVKIIPYSINIECYDESLHNEFFGVESPENSTDIILREDGVYQISRTISAKGIPLGSANSGLDNAIDFVKSFAGKENVPIPEDDPNIKIHLESNSESIDRLLNTYSIQENYIADKNDTNAGNGILRYSIDLDKKFEGFKLITISGDLKFGKDDTFETVRNRFKNIDFYEEVKTKLGLSDLVRIPTNSEITENEKQKSINFSFTFDDNDNFDSCSVLREINYSITESADKISIDLSGSIKSRGPAQRRWDVVSEHFYNSSYGSSYSSWINEAAQDEIDKYFSGIQLNTTPEGTSVVENKRLGQIDFNYSYTNKESIENFKNLNLSTSVNLPSPNYSVDFNFGGSMNKFIITRSGFKNGSISVSISGIYEDIIGDEDLDRRSALIALENKAEEKFSEIKNEIFSSYNSVTTSINKAYSKNSNEASFRETRNYYEI